MDIYLWLFGVGSLGEHCEGISGYVGSKYFVVYDGNVGLMRGQENAGKMFFVLQNILWGYWVFWDGERGPAVSSLLLC